MQHHTNRITQITAFVTPVVRHWLEREIAQWVHHKGSIRRPTAPWADTLTTELHLAPSTDVARPSEQMAKQQWGPPPPQTTGMILVGGPRPSWPLDIVHPVHPLATPLAPRNTYTTTELQCLPSQTSNMFTVTELQCLPSQTSNMFTVGD